MDSSHAAIPSKDNFRKIPNREGESASHSQILSISPGPRIAGELRPLNTTPLLVPRPTTSRRRNRRKLQTNDSDMSRKPLPKAPAMSPRQRADRARKKKFDIITTEPDGLITQKMIVTTRKSQRSSEGQLKHLTLTIPNDISIDHASLLPVSTVPVDDPALSSKVESNSLSPPETPPHIPTLPRPPGISPLHSEGIHSPVGTEATLVSPATDPSSSSSSSSRFSSTTTLALAFRPVHWWRDETERAGPCEAHVPSVPPITTTFRVSSDRSTISSSEFPQAPGGLDHERGPLPSESMSLANSDDSSELSTTTNREASTPDPIGVGMTAASDTSVAPLDDEELELQYPYEVEEWLDNRKQPRGVGALVFNFGHSNYPWGLIPDNENEDFADVESLELVYPTS